MAKAKNREILEALTNESMEIAEKINLEDYSAERGMEVYQTLMDYPTLKNEFISTLVNKVVRTQFFSKVFENPLTLFKKGELPYGTTIEQLFVEMADVKGFREHFEGNTTFEADLILANKPKVKVKYITKNFEYEAKASISQAQLKNAFMSEEGLSNLINQIISQLMNGMKYKDFTDVLALLKASADAKQLVMNGDTGMTKEQALSSSEIAQPMATISVDYSNAANLVEAIRATAGEMAFPSDRFNMAGVNTWSNREDLVFITTPQVSAKLDVSVLAHAFNISSADVKIHTVEIPEASMPKRFATGVGAHGGEDKQCLGFLVDRDFIQIWDTLQHTATFENPDRLHTNTFAHHQGILACAYFANACAFLAE